MGLRNLLNHRWLIGWLVLLVSLSRLIHTVIYWIRLLFYTRRRTFIHTFTYTNIASTFQISYKHLPPNQTKPNPNIHSSYQVLVIYSFWLSVIFQTIPQSHSLTHSHRHHHQSKLPSPSGKPETGTGPVPPPGPIHTTLRCRVSLPIPSRASDAQLARGHICDCEHTNTPDLPTSARQ